MSSPLALHTLLELHGCDPALLKDAEALRPLLLDAVRAGHGTVVTEIFHNFSPHGVSGVIVIAESHVAIHTWPEHGYAAVDIFSCSSALDQVKIENCIRLGLRASHVSRRAFERGQIEPDSPEASEKSGGHP
jgi:S-adenosylmethionine decarboxylase